MNKIKLYYVGYLIALFVVLNSFAWIYADQIGKRLIPFYSFVFLKMTTHYKLQNMRLEKQSGESVYKVYVISREKPSTERKVPSGVELSSSTLMAHSLQMMIVFFSVLLIWPIRSIYQRSLLLIFSLPFLAVLLAIDVPLVLLGSLEDILLYYYHPTLLKKSSAVLWMSMMNSGGRLALALFTPLVLIGVFKIKSTCEKKV